MNSYTSKFYDDIINLPNDALHFKTIERDGDQQLKDRCGKEVKIASKKIEDFYDFMHKELLKYLMMKV